MNKLIAIAFLYFLSGLTILSIWYYEDNCVPCCKFCNVAKAQYTEEYFLERIVNMFKNLKLKGVI